MRLSSICEVPQMPFVRTSLKSPVWVAAVGLSALIAAGCTPAEPTKKAAAEPAATAEVPAAAATPAPASTPVVGSAVEAAGEPEAAVSPATQQAATPVPVPAQRSSTPQAPAATPTPAPVVRASTGLPAGPGRDVTQRVCTACHAIGMVTAKGRTSQEWAEIIGRMQGLGLEASDDDLYAIHDYLSRELPPRRGN